MRIQLLPICALALFFSVLEAKSQQLLAGIHVKAGIPVAEFKSKSGIPVLPEVGLNFLHVIEGTPIFIGADIGYGLYGTEVTKRRDVFPGVNQRFRIRRNNNYISLLGLVRLMPNLNSRLRPFLEGQIGGIHTYTRSHIRENRWEEPIASGTEFYDWAMLLEAGAGIMVALNPSRDTFLELKVHYVDANQMDFLTKESTFYNEQGDLIVIPIRAGFKMLQPSLALKYTFN